MYLHVHMYIHTHTYIPYVPTYTYVHTYTHTHIPYVPTYTYVHTHTHTYNLRFLTQNVHCFLQSPQANSMTTPEIKPRPLPIYYTDKVPFDVTQHEVLAASLNRIQTRHSRLSVWFKVCRSSLLSDTGYCNDYVRTNRHNLLYHFCFNPNIRARI